MGVGSFGASKGSRDIRVTNSLSIRLYMVHIYIYIIYIYIYMDPIYGPYIGGEAGGSWVVWGLEF